jgi:predicted nuclease of restriction endonuclease-like (RecB) superfamily
MFKYCAWHLLTTKTVSNEVKKFNKHIINHSVSTMSLPINITEYTQLLNQIKQRVQLAQKRAIFSVSAEMLRMYWDIGEMLFNKQKEAGWGTKILERISADLKNDFPDIKGFSVRNCQFMIQFYKEYNQELTFTKPTVSQIESANTKPSVSQLQTQKFKLPITQIGWAHNVVIMQRVKDVDARYWYMIQTIKHSWSRDFLAEAIKLDYYGKQGALSSNFDTTLPTVQSKQVKEMLKDPYVFDMLTFTDEYTERDIELGLIKHIEKFLLELGRGFAFMGRQYHIEVCDSDYYIDLLFYHVFTHRYVVIELKRGEFKPEYIGKLNFYCSAVDDIMCQEGDNQTIGLLLCQNKDKVKAEYALRDINKPIGISEYALGQALPEQLRSSLPTIEEIENNLNKNSIE